MSKNFILFFCSFFVINSVAAFIPFQNPTWPSTYDMAASTITMACNRSGWTNATFGAGFGIVSYDWSNAKEQWALAHPMDCEERLVEQCKMTKAENPRAHVFAYRNLVKALPWFSTVREKLENPDYSGFFLKFKPGGSLPGGLYHVPACDYNYDPPLCSEFYHDQLQSPGVPNNQNPNPDGICEGQCDCGRVPCGEYLFDFRNGSMLEDFILRDVIGGMNGIENPSVDGFFIDDYWCSNLLNSSCTNPANGPSEVDAYSQIDMGLSDEEILKITQGWLKVFTKVQQLIINRGKYTWSLIPGQANANAAPTQISSTKQCVSFLRDASNSAFESAPLLYGLTLNDDTNDRNDEWDDHVSDDGSEFKQLQLDVALFLSARGPYAYIGYGTWGMTWPPALPFPELLNQNFGQPHGLCKEKHNEKGVFERVYDKAIVQVDCNTLTSEIVKRN